MSDGSGSRRGLDWKWYAAFIVAVLSCVAAWLTVIPESERWPFDENGGAFVPSPTLNLDLDGNLEEVTRTVATPVPPTSTPHYAFEPAVPTTIIPPTFTPVLPTPTIVPPTPTRVSSEVVFFGDSRNIGGLVVSVSPPDYDSGCGGTLDFEVVLSNETEYPIVLSFGLTDLKLLGDDGSRLSLYGDLGAATPRCYSSFHVETLAPDSTARLALRTTDSLGAYSYLELVFGENTGRLAGMKWRLDLDRAYEVERTLFGESINVEGLEVTVGEENYFPGCGGTLGFQVTLRNATDRPIILGLRSGDLKLYGDDHRSLSVYSELGRQSTECYGGFRLETIKAGETVLIAVRTTSSLSGLSYVDFVFEADNRLDGLRWRLELPR